MRKILATLTLSLLLFGADAFIGSQTALLDKAGGKELAALHVGAKVKVLGDSGEYTQVEYKGFVPEEGANAYARLGILELDLTAKDTKTLEVIGKKMDDYDNEWLEVSVKGFVKKEVLKNDITQIYTSGESLFKERCGGCHALHGYDEFGVNVWPSVIETMIANSALEPNEFEEVVRFLQSKAPVE